MFNLAERRFGRVVVVHVLYKEQDCGGVLALLFIIRVGERICKSSSNMVMASEPN
jgi:hypothetical protein